MKTKIVYALISDENDFYLEQLLLSLYSLRKYNPNACVEIVCDNDTFDSIKGKREVIKDYNITLIPIDLSHIPDKMHKSRQLKTYLRKYVTGDFMFLDTDTIIMKDLSDIDKTKADMGFVTDCNLKHIIESEYEKCEKVGFEHLKKTPFFNSGVIYAKDNESVYKFYENWNKTWKETLSKGIPNDQPSFNNTIYSQIVNYKRIPDQWNYQFRCGPHVSNPKILHYFGGYYTKYFWKTFKIPLIENPKSSLCNHLISLLICHQALADSNRFNNFFLSQTGWLVFNAPDVYKKFGKLNNLIIKCFLWVHKIFKGK